MSYAPFVVEAVERYYREHGYGITRRELAAELGWVQTKNLPGVRQAISEQRIRYDGSAEGRLVPVELGERAS